MSALFQFFGAGFVATCQCWRGSLRRIFSRFQILCLPPFVKAVIIGILMLSCSRVSAQDFQFEGGSYAFGETSFTATVDRTIGIEDVDLVLALQSDQFGVIEDLEITLTSPEGTTVRLIASGVLGDLNGFLRGDRLQDSRFSGEAPVSIEQGTSPYTASYKADDASASNSMSLFEGERATGVWILKVKDTVGLGGAVFGVGNSSNAGWQTEGTRLVITVVPPPSTPDMLPESDSGASNADDLTNVETPVFTGTSKPNLTVSLYDGDTELATTTADAEGFWTVTIPTALTAGIHSVAAKATDTNGNDSLFSSPLTVHVDPNAPVISSIPDQNVVEDATLERVPFVVADDVTESASLVVRVEGSDVGLIPVENLVLSGSDADRFVAITPLPQGNGEALITITVTDLAGNVGVRSFSVLVAAVNDEPVINAISNAVISEGTELRVVATASDIDGDVLTYTLEGAPSGASINAQSGVIVWTPSEVQGPGSHTITVRATDPGGFSVAHSFAIDVLEVNQGPIVAPIADLAFNEETALAFRIAAADPDLPINVLSFSLAANAPVGSVIDATTGEFKWTPDESQGPGTYPISVVITDDGQPSMSVIASFTVSVGELNLAPVVEPIASQSVVEGSVLSFFVPVFDHDIPVNQLTFSLGAGAPAEASVDVTTGQFIWSPVEGQGPGNYDFTLTVTDNGAGHLAASRTFSVTVQESNSPPTLAAVPDQSVRNGSMLTVNLTASDPDLPANRLIYSFPAAVPPGAFIDPVTGVFSWTPELGATARTTAIAVQVTDNGSPSLSDVQTFLVHTSPSNLAPVVDPISDQSVNEGEMFTVGVLAIDDDLPAQTLVFALGGGEPDGAVIDSETGVVTWIPTEVQGPATYRFSVVVTDNGTPALSTVETFIVIVNEVNTSPALAAVGDQPVQAGSQVTFTAMGSDPDSPNNVLTYSLGAGAPEGAVISAATGVFSWTPPFAVEPSTNVITVRVSDNGTPSLSASQDVTVTVAPSNQAPVLTPIANQTVSEETVLAVPITANDPDQPLSYELIQAPSGATLDSATGLFSWLPDEEQGPSPNAVTVRVTDNGTPPLSATSEFTVFVQEVNQAPVIEPINDQSVQQGDLLSATVVATDPDLPANSLSYSLGPGAPAGASIDPVSGLFTWTPSAQQAPSTSVITVQVSDSGVPSLSVSRSFTVVASMINTAPTLVAIGPQTVDEGQLLSFAAVGGDNDLPTQRLVYSLGSGAPEGAIINATDGVFTFTPTEVQGPATNLVSVRVTDNGNPPLRSVEDVMVVINEVNRVPVLNAIADQTLGVGDTLSLQAHATDPDLPINTLTFSLGTGAPVGAAIDATSGVFTWTTTAAQGATTNRITLQVADNGVSSLSDTKTFTAIVRAGPNLPPTISSIANQTTPENTPTASIAFTIDDPDTPIGNLSLKAVSSDAALVPLESIAFGGSETDRTVRITPARNRTGTATVTIEVTEPAGGKASVSFAVLVTPTPPGIVRQPADRTVLGVSVLTLSVLATGSVPLSYQWSFDGGTIEGATDSVLNIANAQAQDGGLYSVKISNAVGSVTSREAQVVVNVLLRITEQPLSQKVLTGGSATFRVAASGTPPLSYQWSVNGIDVPGGTGAALTLENVEPVLAGSYSVAVTDTSGTVTSRAAALEVLAPAVITEQPAGQTVPAGTNVTFSVSAGGTPPLDYQWVYNGVNLAGETNNTLRLSNVIVANAGSYATVVFNAGGSVTSEGAQLTVSLPPTITRQPQGQRVLTGAPLQLDVTVSATPPLSYQWQQNGADIAGATGPRVTLDSSTLAAAGEYTVRVSNAAGSVTSQSALVEVTQPVTITAQPVDQTVVEGAAASFSVTVTGTGLLSYQWRKGGVSVNGATNATLRVNNARTVDAGGYQVVVSNGAGPVTSAVAKLTVNVGVRILSQPQSLAVINGSSAAFSVAAVGTAPLTYQWQFNGTDIAGATGPNLGLPNLHPSDAGAYSVVVQNAVGPVTSIEAVLNILIPPVIQEHPAGQTVDLGGSATFDVVTTGDQPLSYQWQRNGGNISAATSDTLTLSNVQAADAGSYSVVAQNPGGAVSSLSASLTLNLPALNTSNSAATAPPPIDQSEGTFYGGNTTGGGVQIARRSTSPGAGEERWFAWRAPNSGIATFSTAGSTFDTVLTIYTGTTPNLVEITSDDDRGGFLSSHVRFNAVQGTAYLINVKGFGGAAGEIIVSFKLEPTTQKLPELVSIPPSRTAAFGSDVTFGVEAAGTQLSYQWLANGVEIAGATETSLVLSNVRESDALYYSVRVTSGTETVESLPASLQVGTLGEVAQDKFKNAAGTTGSSPQLARAIALANRRMGALQQAASTATLVFSTYGSAKEQGEPNHCGVVGGASQWLKYVASETGVVRFSTEGSNFDTVLAVYGGTEFSTLTLEGCDNNSGADGKTSVVNVQVTGGRTYYIAVDGAGGETGLVKLSYELGQVPAITLQPLDQSVELESSVALFALTAAQSGLSYQWYKNGLPMAGQDQPALQFLSVQTEDVGSYTLEISNFAGTVRSQVAELTVNVPLSLSVPPVDQEAGLGGTARFAVVVNGSEPISYQWSLNGIPIAGATHEVIEITNVQAPDAGSYKVKAENATGTIESEAAVLTISRAPVIAAPPQSGVMALGGEASLSVVASGTGELSYQWRLNGLDISQATGATLVIGGLGPQDVGDYTVVVSNAVGVTESAAARLSVRVSLGLVEHPRNQVVTVGSSAIFTVRASGAGPFDYQWKVDGAEISGATGATYVVVGARESDAGDYTVIVSHGAEAIESEVAVLTVDRLPVITQQPQSQLVIAGGDPVLEVAASGSEPLSYQWIYNGTAMGGATNVVLRLSAFGADSEGAYSVEVSNSAGRVESELAVLSLLEVISDVRLDAVGFGFRLNVPEGSQARVQFTTDFIEWIDLTPAPLTGTVDVTDPDSITAQFRFYRVVIE